MSAPHVVPLEAPTLTARPAARGLHRPRPGSSRHRRAVPRFRASPRRCVDRPHRHGSCRIPRPRFFAKGKERNRQIRPRGEGSSAQTAGRATDRAHRTERPTNGIWSSSTVSPHAAHRPRPRRLHPPRQRGGLRGRAAARHRAAPRRGGPGKPGRGVGAHPAPGRRTLDPDRPRAQQLGGRLARSGSHPRAGLQRLGRPNPGAGSGGHARRVRRLEPERNAGGRALGRAAALLLLRKPRARLALRHGARTLGSALRRTGGRHPVLELECADGPRTARSGSPTGPLSHTRHVLRRGVRPGDRWPGSGQGRLGLAGPGRRSTRGGAPPAPQGQATGRSGHRPAAQLDPADGAGRRLESRSRTHHRRPDRPQPQPRSRSRSRSQIRSRAPPQRRTPRPDICSQAEAMGLACRPVDRSNDPLYIGLAILALAGVAAGGIGSLVARSRRQARARQRSQRRRNEDF